MRIRDPHHEKKHHAVTAVAGIAIVLVFVVWFFQLREMFVLRAAQQLEEDFGQISADVQAGLDYAENVQALIPGLEGSLEDVLTQLEQGNLLDQATDLSEQRVVTEIIERLQVEASEREATAQAQETEDGEDTQAAVSDQEGEINEQEGIE